VSVSEIITLSERLPDPGAYRRLFETTGWNEEYQATEEELYEAISGSWYFLASYDGQGQLVGFGRIVSDGVLYGLVCDMIVSPEHQGRGTGTRIMEALVSRCEEAGLRVLWLFAANGKAPFYERGGFEAGPPGAPGMQMILY